MQASKNSNVEGDRPSTNKLQKSIAEYELYVICARVGEGNREKRLSQLDSLFNVCFLAR